MEDLSIIVPGTYSYNSPLINIKQISSTIPILNSKQRPRKIWFIGSNGKKYDFLLKANEDTRLDERVMQFFEYINSIISESSIPLKKLLNITTYTVTPLSSSVGLIGWVTGCETLFNVIKEYRNLHSIELEKEYIAGNSKDYQTLSLDEKLHLFKKGVDSTPGDEIKKILYIQASDCVDWLARRSAYTTSLAVNSISGYIMGLGDRHMQNIMINSKTAKLVHIDFGDCFEVTQHRSKYPELVPFRLTRMLVNALEVTQLSGTFRFCCVNIMKHIRRNHEQILSLFDVFIYDPLLQWMVDGSESNSAARVISRITDKLFGNDFPSTRSLSASSQVDNLIHQATDHANLCQMFPGWYPWW